jgi:hypothetical protein
MNHLRRVVALAWILVAIAIAVSSALETGGEFWRPSWLIVGIVGVCAAAACSASLYSQGRNLRVLGSVSASAFVLYYAYLFSISPPDEINVYFLSGFGLIALSLVTIGAVFFGRGRLAKLS